MKVTVLFFGPTRDLTGFDREQVELHEGARLDALRRQYEARFPGLRDLTRSVVAAVNQELVEPSWPLRDGDEVAFLPPVSGGAGDGSTTSGDIFRITREAIGTRELVEELKAPEDGAVVAFEGIARNNLRGRRTVYLEYEAYEPMALARLREIGGEARQQFAIDHLGIIHRLGRVEIGETSVAIVVASPHRAAAFDACRFLINRLKQTVPIWKKEHFEDGTMWAESEAERIGEIRT